MHIIHHMEWESNSSKCMIDEKDIQRIQDEYTWKVRDGALAWTYGTNVYNYQRVRVLDWSWKDWKDWKDRRNMLQVFENTSTSISCLVNSSVNLLTYHKLYLLRNSPGALSILKALRSPPSWSTDLKGHDAVQIPAANNFSKRMQTVGEQMQAAYHGKATHI